jgi:hypothetical protein
MDYRFHCYKQSSSRSSLIWLTITGLSICGALTGCGKPFNVKPKNEVALPAPDLSSGENAIGAISVAAAVIDEDQLYDIFDANLLMAGIVAVRVRLTNTGAQPTDLRGTGFELRAGDDAFKPVEWKRVYKRLMSYYGISMYSKSAYKQSRGDFASHALETSGKVGAGESREGLVFFFVPEEISRSRGLTLVARGGAGRRPKTTATLELKLDRTTGPL